VIVLHVRHRGAPFTYSLSPARGSTVVRQREVRPPPTGSASSVSIAIMFAGGECASDAHSLPSSIVSR